MKSLVKLIYLCLMVRMMTCGDSEEESEDQANHGDVHDRPQFFISKHKILVMDIYSALDE